MRQRHLRWDGFLHGRMGRTEGKGSSFDTTEQMMRRPCFLRRGLTRTAGLSIRNGTIPAAFFESRLEIRFNK